jgi:hypothetical protein
MGKTHEPEELSTAADKGTGSLAHVRWDAEGIEAPALRSGQLGVGEQAQAEGCGRQRTTSEGVRHDGVPVCVGYQCGRARRVEEIGELNISDYNKVSPLHPSHCR